MEVERVITYYDRKTKFIAGEYPLIIGIDILSQIFRVGKKDPLMYDCYQITPKISRLLSDIGVYVTYDFKKYAYYVECYQKGS